MDILSPVQHKALAFVAAANQGGHSPTEDEIGLWLDDSSPRRSGGILSTRDLAVQAWSIGQIMRGVPESTVAHLDRLGWLSSSRLYGRNGVVGGWTVTPLGQALLRAAELGGDEGADTVVLDNEDPLAYSKMIGEVSSMGEALLVDPYLDLAGCFDILHNTSVRRVLVGDGNNTAKQRSAIRTLLSQTEPQPVLEVRAASGLHDRMVVSGEGGVSTIGASMNGVKRRKSITIFNPLPPEAASVMREVAESWWESATPVWAPGPEEAPEGSADLEE